MSSKVFFKQENSPYKVSVWTFFFCALFLLGGCGSKTTSITPAAKFTQGSVADAKLSAQERQIFYKTGQLDKDLPKIALPAVAKQYSHFLYGGRRTMEVFSQRAEDYLGHARQIFREKGMPEELAYLAIVESGYKPTVKSHAGALGTWQFMPYTGKLYGLRQDKWLDERLDPYKSVEAAATYLKRLHGYFGDWLLAVAAYNAGEGKIGRALEATGAKDFFTLVERNHTLSHKMQLRTETMVYVPRFLAVSKIMRNLGPLGFESVNHNQQPLHARISVRPNTNLKGLAKASGLSWSEFRTLNASHKKSVTHNKHYTYVYVPHHAVSRSKSYASSSANRVVVAAPSSSKNTASAGTYKVKSGDTLSAIAVRHNISLAKLTQLNKLQASSKIKVGQVLVVKGTAPRAVASTATGAKMTSYKVKSGESLSTIAHRHNTTVAALMQQNKLRDASKVRAGQIIKVPAAKHVAQKRVHVVKYGDTVGAIALQYNLSTSQLLKINKKNSASIREGEKLLVSMR